MNISSVSQASSPNFGAFRIESNVLKKHGQFIGAGKFLYEEGNNINKTYRNIDGHTKFRMMEDVILPTMSRQEGNKVDIVLTDIPSKTQKGGTDVLLLLRDKLGNVLKSVGLEHKTNVVKDANGKNVVETSFTNTLKEFENIANKS